MFYVSSLEAISLWIYVFMRFLVDEQTLPPNFFVHVYIVFF